MRDEWAGYRIATVKDILYCDDHCSKEAYNKIVDMWSGERIKYVEQSRDVSSLKVEELTLMNRLFGSDSTCHPIADIDLQKDILKIMPFDLYKNFRRATYKRPMTVMVEDWVWTEDTVEFLNEMDIELTCLENVIVSLLLYLLGGFTLPRDDQKKDMDPWVKVNVHSLFNRPRELFLLTSMSPAVLTRYTYWKCTSVLMGLMRHFSARVRYEDVTYLCKQLKLKGVSNGNKSEDRG